MVLLVVWMLRDMALVYRLTLQGEIFFRESSSLIFLRSFKRNFHQMMSEKLRRFMDEIQMTVLRRRIPDEWCRLPRG